MNSLMDLWIPKFEKKNQWRDLAVNNYIDSLVDDEIKQILRSSLSGTVPVSLYGKSQVGKTTFLLKLMDIKDECLENIHDILRCGSKSGNAATPTAMIYKRNPGECFKVHYSTHSCEFYSEEDIRCELIELRRKVENQELQQLEEITIEIPERYFNNYVKINIQVCDLPGIDSSNEKERLHVEKVLKKFIPISALILVFQIGNDINDVSNLFNNDVMSEIYGWKYMADRYRLIITRAYSAESVAAQINNGYLNISKEDIKHFYRIQANNDPSNPNNVPDKVNIFPFELGESFRDTLPGKYDTGGLNAIINVMNELWAEIREDIRITSETGNVVKRISIIPHLLQNLIKDKKSELEGVMNQKSKLIQEMESLKNMHSNNTKINHERISSLNQEIQFFRETKYLGKYNHYNGERRRSTLIDFIDSIIEKFHRQLNEIHYTIPFDHRDSWNSGVESLFNWIRAEISDKNETAILWIGGPQKWHIENLNGKISELNSLIDNHYNPEITRIRDNYIHAKESDIWNLTNQISENTSHINNLMNEINKLNAEKDAIHFDYSARIRGYEEELERKSDIFHFMWQAVFAEKEFILRELDNKANVEAFLDLMYIGLIIKEYQKQQKYN